MSELLLAASLTPWWCVTACTALVVGTALYGLE